jgi:hypothetical protein
MREKKPWFKVSRTLTIFAITMMLPAAAAPASQYKVLHRFTGPDGSHPFGGLVFDAAGNLYGTTKDGGSLSAGTAFKLTPNADGSWTESVLYSFCTGCGGGYSPISNLIFDAQGNLYGTTPLGNGGGTGVAFQLKPNADGSWTENVLHRFGFLGKEPAAGLIFDAAGNLYGTTLFGGSGTGCGSAGCGVVFKLKPNANGTWSEIVLYNFCSISPCSDGAHPSAGLIFDVAGNLYGTTQGGGTGGSSFCSSSPPSCGVVFKLTPHPDGTWAESVLYNFCSLAACSDGYDPAAGLTFDASGNLYGTTIFGGSGCVGNLCGVVFKLTPQSDGSWTERVLHAFQDHPAAQPNAALIFDATGNLYGTAANDVGVTGFGAVFKLAPKPGGGWAYSVLRTFYDHPAAFPYDSLVLDKAGNLYGTASDCANGNVCNGDGVVFEISP